MGRAVPNGEGVFASRVQLNGVCCALIAVAPIARAFSYPAALDAVTSLDLSAERSAAAWRHAWAEYVLWDVGVRMIR